MADNFDFMDYKTRRLWDWTVDTIYWQSVWASANNLQVTNGGQSAIPGFLTYPTGIAYRLPNYEDTAKNYGPPFGKTNLQFRSTFDLKAMAQIRCWTMKANTTRTTNGTQNLAPCI
jgi:hypothetical protein